MSDRNLSSCVEERLADGPYWRLEISRSASGRPGLLFTILHDSFDGTLHDEMTVVVPDGNELLLPVMEWLENE